MSLRERYLWLQERIQTAALRSGRSPDAVTLVAVSKTHPADVVLEAYAAGIRHFGENRAQELEEKQAAVTALAGPLPDLHWHFIGALQTRQSLPIAQIAAYFHAVDRVKIAERLSRQLSDLGRQLPVFLEVNISGESSKAGFPAQHWQQDAAQQAALQAAVATMVALPRIEVRGLMTMAPWDAPESVIRSVFRRTRELAAWLQLVAPQAAWQSLSMGMTDDFEIAIEEGATHVRIGRALFGERQP